MTAANILFTAVGAVALLIGLGTLASALRLRNSDEKKSAAMLIVGMMLTAFGLVLGGFAIAYTETKPYDFNTAATGAN